jgi:hypothetical protein
MSKKQLLPPIENENDYRRVLLSILSKFNSNHTLKVANSELRELMNEHITSADRMNLFLNHLNDSSEFLKSNQKKEFIKVYTMASEIFEESLVPFLPKVIFHLSKRLKETDNMTHTAASDAFGTLVHHVLKNIENVDEAVEVFNTHFFKLILGILSSAN